jgi:hypothetical protein
MRRDAIAFIFTFIIFVICDPNYPRNQFEYQKRRAAKPKIVRSADLNGDGIVNLKDWAIFAQHWLEGE